MGDNRLIKELDSLMATINNAVIPSLSSMISNLEEEVKNAPEDQKAKIMAEINKAKAQLYNTSVKIKENRV